MYWRIGESAADWPAPDWDRRKLVSGLAPFQGDPARMRPLSPLEIAYCRFYALDLETDFPSVTHRLGQLVVGGYHIAVHRYVQEQATRGTVFVLHGYFDHTGLYSQLFFHLLEKGYDLVAYDLPGHGLSDGPRASIRSFEDYQRVLQGVLDAVEAHAPKPWHAIGQSTGGAILIDRRLGIRPGARSFPFQQLVLLAPLIRPMGWRTGRLAHSLLAPFFRTWKRVFSENSNDSRFLRFLQRHDPLQSREMAMDWVAALKRWVPRIERAAPVDQPLTVIQGEKDMTVDWRHNLKVIRRLFPNARIHCLPQGRHHLVNESPELLEQIFGWIDEGLENGDNARR